MESHLNLALCSLEITQNQVKDQSKQIEQLTSIFKDQQLINQSQQLNDQSQQIERLVAKNTEQSQQIERLVAKNTEQSQQLHNQSQQLNDHSQQLNDQSQQIERLVAKNTEQSQQIAILTSTVQGLVQQVEPLRSQPQYQAAMVDPTATKQTKDQTNKIGATNAYVKEGKFL